MPFPSRPFRFAAAAALFMLCATAANAHFQLLLPSTPALTIEAGRTITLDLVFTHPMERGPVMDMGTPEEFGVMVRGEKTDLRESLSARTVEGKQAFQAAYEVQRPGAHIFYLAPAPYWEAGEGAMIQHFTKVVVDAFGAWGGWDSLVGFPVEIEPLTRPYGLWTGNVFQGIVRRDGEPAPFAHVEVEYHNEDGAVTAPADPYITQVIRADANGVFTYGLPRAGWWGFTALVRGDAPVENPEGEMVRAELGGVIWVHARDMRADAPGGKE